MDAAKSSNMTQHLMVGDTVSATRTSAPVAVTLTFVLTLERQECQYLFLRLCCADRLKTLAVNPTVSVSLCPRQPHHQSLLSF